MLLIVLTIQHFCLYLFLFPFFNSSTVKNRQELLGTLWSSTDGRSTTKKWTQQRPRFTWPILARHDLHLLSTIFGVRTEGNFTLAAPQYTKTGLMICNYIKPQIKVPMINVPSSSSDIQSIKRHIFIQPGSPPAVLFKGRILTSLAAIFIFCSPVMRIVHNFCMQSLLKHFKI